MSSILDPACGEGALLTSIVQKLKGEVANYNYRLLGFDSNQDFLRKAQQNLLKEANPENIYLTQTDFLKSIDIKTSQASLFDPISPTQAINESIDVVIANPPYVRTQVLGAEYAQEISKKFGLSGRVDLYYPFLIAITHALKEGGIAGVITSNRYLSTKSGGTIRGFLQEHFEILEVIDLGDTKLFDAAVLPAIFIGRKRKQKKKSEFSHFMKIYETDELATIHEGNTSIEEVLSSSLDGVFEVEAKKYKKTSGIIRYTNTKDNGWALLNEKESLWIDEIHESAHSRVKDWFKVRVGIKTTADKIFIRDDWESVEEKPEGELLKDLISQENIESWGASTEKQLKVLYPHYSLEGKRQVIDLKEYPKAEKYFLKHKKRLSSRKYLKKAGRNWFEVWVPQNPDLWSKPKLVFPDISPSPRFYLDKSGKIVNGNCYWIVAKQPEELKILKLIQGVANTSFMTKYHDLMFNNRLYAGRRRYFTQFVEKYPLPKPDSREASKIISIVEKLQIAKSRERKVLCDELEVAVAEAFKVTPITP